MPCAETADGHARRGGRDRDGMPAVGGEPGRALDRPQRPTLGGPQRHAPCRRPDSHEPRVSLPRAHPPHARPCVTTCCDEATSSRQPSNPDVLELMRSSEIPFPLSDLQTRRSEAVTARGGGRAREKSPVRSAARRTPEQPRPRRPSARALRPTCEDDRLGDRPRTSVDGGSQQAALPLG